MFVIDTSGSIGTTHSQLIREFTDDIAAELIRNSPESAVGKILFDSSAPHVQFNLHSNTSLNSLLSAIDDLLNSGGLSDTDEALQLLLSIIQNRVLGLGGDSSKVVIVITDGQSSSSSAILSAVSAALHALNIFDVYAVGVGGANLTELEEIASNPEFVFFTSSFNGTDLQQLQDGILSQLCDGKYP